jgi:hypothetical protein
MLAACPTSHPFWVHSLITFVAGFTLCNSLRLRCTYAPQYLLLSTLNVCSFLTHVTAGDIMALFSSLHIYRKKSDDHESDLSKHSLKVIYMRTFLPTKWNSFWISVWFVLLVLKYLNTYHIFYWFFCVSNSNGFLIKWLDLLALILQIQPIITAHNQWLSTTRSAPYWTTSVFSPAWVTWFRFTNPLHLPLVSTPQLNTQPLNCLLNSLMNESLEITNVLFFITSREPHRSHHNGDFVFWSVVRCSGN